MKILINQRGNLNQMNKNGDEINFKDTIRKAKKKKTRKREAQMRTQKKDED